jgi:hypothetical protein
MVVVLEDTNVPFANIPYLHNLKLGHVSSRPASSHQQLVDPPASYLWVQQT